MPEAKQEIVVTFYEDKELCAILHMNGSKEFYKVRKMNRTEVAELLGAKSE